MGSYAAIRKRGQVRAYGLGRGAQELPGGGGGAGNQGVEPGI